DVKTVVSRRRLEIAAGKTSQEFTARLTCGQGVSQSVSACRAFLVVSFRPVAVATDYRYGAGHRGEDYAFRADVCSRGRPRPDSARLRDGLARTRNTVPSRTFAEVSLDGHCGHRPNVRVAR